MAGKRRAVGGPRRALRETSVRRSMRPDGRGGHQGGGGRCGCVEVGDVLRASHMRRGCVGWGGGGCFLLSSGGWGGGAGVAEWPGAALLWHSEKGGPEGWGRGGTEASRRCPGVAHGPCGWGRGCPPPPPRPNGGAGANKHGCGPSNVGPDCELHVHPQSTPLLGLAGG